MVTLLDPFKNSRGFWNIFIIIIIALIVIFVFGVGRSQVETFLSSMIDNSAKVSNSWVTHDSGTLGASFRYPPEWKIDDQVGDKGVNGATVNSGASVSAQNSNEKVQFIIDYDGNPPTGDVAGTFTVATVDRTYNINRYLVYDQIYIFVQDGSRRLTIKGTYPQSDKNVEGIIKGIISTLVFR